MCPRRTRSSMVGGPSRKPGVLGSRGLIRTGLSGSKAAKRVGVSLSCRSLWFIDAGRVSFIETPISPRYLSQDDRIEIADGLARGEPVKQIAAQIGKSYQSVHREIACNRKPGGRYQPWYAHNQAWLRRRRSKPRRLSVDAELREVVAGKLAKHWSPARLACLHPDHLRGGLPGPGSPGERPEPAHRPHLPASPWPGPHPRWRAQAVHVDEVDPPATHRCPFPASGRALGG